MFKIGDMVTLVNKDVRHMWNNNLQIGTIYEVIEYHKKYGDDDITHPSVCLEVKCKNGNIFGWWVYVGSVIKGKQLLFDFMYE